jgi:hypothetical protein
VLRLALGLWLGAAEPEEPEAPPVAIELRWAAPEECPDREAFLEALDAIAGRRLVEAQGAALVVDGRIEALGRGYALALRLRGPAGEEVRTLEASECEDLASAGSLVVVTRLLGDVPAPPEDRARSPEEGLRSPEETAAAPTDAAVPLPPPGADESQPSLVSDEVAPLPEPGPHVEPRPAGRPRPQATLVALAGVAVGLGPRPAGLVRGGVGLRWGSVRVEAFAMHVLATRTGGGDVPGVRASLTGAGALGCWAPAWGRLELPLCGGLELGAVVGRGVGPLVATREGVRQLWIGLPLEAGVAWAPIPRLALRALVGGDIGLLRPGFHVDIGDERTAIARPWPVGLHAGGGLELRLP